MEPDDELKPLWLALLLAVSVFFSSVWDGTTHTLTFLLMCAGIPVATIAYLWAVPRDEVKVRDASLFAMFFLPCLCCGEGIVAAIVG